MREISEFFLGILILVGVYLVTQRIVLWRLRRTCDSVLKDLEQKKAFDADSAVPLPYARKDFLRIGVRDYRPKAVEALLAGGKVSLNQEGAYYLTKGTFSEKQ